MIGNVEIEKVKGEKLDRELVYWDENKKGVYWDEGVGIEEGEEIIYGIGFE